MNQQLLDKKTADPTRPRRAGRRRGNRLEQQPRRHAEHAAGPASEPAPSAGRSAADRPSATERRRRSEALAQVLDGAADLDELVAIIKEHGRLAAARAAAVRPDLMPVINGEFAHIALSLADLD